MIDGIKRPDWLFPSATDEQYIGSIFMTVMVVVGLGILLTLFIAIQKNSADRLSMALAEPLLADQKQYVIEPYAFSGVRLGQARNTADSTAADYRAYEVYLDDARNLICRTGIMRGGVIEYNVVRLDGPEKRTLIPACLPNDNLALSLIDTLPHKEEFRPQ